MPIKPPYLAKKKRSKLMPYFSSVANIPSMSGRRPGGNSHDVSGRFSQSGCPIPTSAFLATSSNQMDATPGNPLAIINFPDPNLNREINDAIDTFSMPLSGLDQQRKSLPIQQLLLFKVGGVMGGALMQAVMLGSPLKWALLAELALAFGTTGLIKYVSTATNAATQKIMETINRFVDGHHTPAAKMTQAQKENCFPILTLILSIPATAIGIGLNVKFSKLHSSKMRGAIKDTNLIKAIMGEPHRGNYITQLVSQDNIFNRNLLRPAVRLGLNIGSRLGALRREKPALFYTGMFLMGIAAAAQEAAICLWLARKKHHNAAGK